KPGNLLKHLRKHKTTSLIWINQYEHFKEEKKETKQQIDRTHIRLAKFFIRRNIALEALNDVDLRAILDKKIGKFSFTQRILPKLMNFLKTKITEQLQRAVNVSLIVDMWSNNEKEEYLAVAVSTIKKNFEKELFVIGIVRMEGRQRAEEVKSSVELIVNKFEFDKKKISAVVVDEGSNILRLFKPVDSEEYYYITESEADDEEADETNELGGNLENVTEVETIVLETFEFENYIQSELKKVEFYEPDETFVDYTEYEHGAQLIKDLKICLGSDKIPRFNCSAHKLNLVVRKSIESNRHVSKDYQDLQVQLKKDFIEKKIQGVFFGEHRCPVSQREIESYLQILLPIYVITNDIQLIFSNITSIVPYILTLVYGNLDRMVLNEYSQDQFRKSIIRNIITKFDYELNSPIYLAAAVLNVGAVKAWSTRSYYKPYFEKGQKERANFQADSHINSHTNHRNNSQTNHQNNSQTYHQNSSQTNSQINSQTNNQNNSLTNSQIIGQTNHQNSSQTNSQINSQTNHQNNNLFNQNLIQRYADRVGVISKLTRSQLRSVDDNDCDDVELLNKKYNTEIDRLKILLR
ncbi:zinc finger BED domain-containing 1, partial [Brachionus plicatilis]